MPTPRLRRLPRWSMPVLGAAIAALAIAFVVRSLGQDWDRISEAFSDMAIAPALLGLVIAVAAMSAIGALWGVVLTERGAPTRPGTAVRWYFVGELGKYIPGGIWPVLGRSELARRSGAQASAAYASTIVSLLYLYGAAVLTVAGVAPWLDNLPLWSRVILIAGGVAIIGALHPTVDAWVFARLAAISGRPLGIPSPPWGRAVVTVTAYVPAWLLIGAVSWALGVGLGFDVAPVALVGATVAAWLAGFLAIPVPGGAGVREAVFVLLCGLPRAEAAAIAVAARIVFIGVDVAGFAVSAPLLRWLRAATGE
ncbi:MAG: lysylphosphatidylglycerol synthase domain-containing protein [Candidatus Microthrix subdominans]|nr:flippase-like domain-containing protein [Candidatus Microthrix sp.]MBP7596719.1 flippase-like domain-containing protein [Candidatus Microthrix sp.]MBP9067515.1 flippase-like domain-containing protein [Candidatus Microthrix sp.]